MKRTKKQMQDEIDGFQVLIAKYRSEHSENIRKIERLERDAETNKTTIESLQIQLATVKQILSGNATNEQKGAVIKDLFEPEVSVRNKMMNDAIKRGEYHDPFKYDFHF